MPRIPFEDRLGGQCASLHPGRNIHSQPHVGFCPDRDQVLGEVVLIGIRDFYSRLLTHVQARRLF